MHVTPAALPNKHRPPFQALSFHHRVALTRAAPALVWEELIKRPFLHRSQTKYAFLEVYP